MSRSVTKPGDIRIGTSGWVYPHWKEIFYPADLPESKWFAHYASVFDTVEINNTFYHLPSPETFDGWREQAPPGFVYAVKANRFLTHMKKLKDPQEPLKRMLSAVGRLKSRLGPILYHLPPHWKPNLERLREFCEALPKKLTHVFEFRDPAWLVEETFTLLREFGMNLCLHDAVPDHPRQVTGPAIYVRFHGHVPEGNYTHEQLRRWSEWFEEHRRDHVTYVYFNNDLGGHAFRNAQSLRELLGVSPYTS
ncbi:MAG TPA: DUF72 domain-containing protein [Planctomycetaceae bacterium]|nr:DUF72 domain-containing protein [Planctomycetaceae bacterium]